MEPEKTPSSSREQDVLKNKDIAAFSYIWIMSLIVYFARKDSPFIQFHAKQGLILFVLSIPLWFIPIVGPLLEFFILAAAVMGFINAFQGLWSDVPIIGPVSRGEMSAAQALKTVYTSVARLFKQAATEAKREARQQEAKAQPKPENDTSPSKPPSPPAM